MKKRGIFLVFPLAGLILSGCTLPDWIDRIIHPNKEQEKQKENEKEDDKPTVIHVSSVTLNKDSISIEEMQSEQLTYTVSPSNATNKAVEWFTGNSSVATVNDGKVYGVAPGTTTITIKSADGNKTDTCEVEVTAQQIETETRTSVLDFCEQGYTFTTDQGIPIDNPFVVDELTFTYAQGENTKDGPRVFRYSSSEYASRLYPGNTLTIETEKSDSFIRSVVLTYGSKDKTNTITSTPEGFDGVDTWTGASSQVTFKVEGTSDHRRIKSIAVTYDGSEPSPETTINLGVKSISEVREYIAENPVKKNEFGNGVNDKRVVTIKGFAFAKIDLFKYTSTYGLDVSEHGKVIMADSTGYIGVASAVNELGTSLWGKIDDHVNESTSKYIVTGYLSEYLGHPEILVTSFQWDKTLDISIDLSSISSTIDIEGFYSHAVSLNYNCAGHAYGDVFTLNNLNCYYIEKKGQGERYYNFTDGVRNIRVNAFNLSDCTVGKNYNITGIVSMKDLSPIIVAFEIKSSSSQEPIAFDYINQSTETTITDLKKIHGSQKDIDTRIYRFDEVIEAYGTVFQTTGYITAVEEGGKYYVGISDDYIAGDNIISGKDNAMANYGVSLIKNPYFWNVDGNQLRNNPLAAYIFEETAITVYYVVRQQRYQDSKPMWEILLIPEFLESVVVY